MQNNERINIGGSIELALSGQYQLNVMAILREAWKLTLAYFLMFSPAIIILLVVQCAIILIALNLQLTDISIILDIFADPQTIANASQIDVFGNVTLAMYIANISYEILSSPLVAGVMLMALNHTLGISSSVKIFSTGFMFLWQIIALSIICIILQSLANLIFPLLSLYVTIVFIPCYLLVCEKHYSVFQAMLLAFKAINKKIIPLTSLYVTIMLLFMLALVFYGIGLIVVVPFFFHVKAIVYREMFGVKLHLIIDDNNNNADVFNA